MAETLPPLSGPESFDPDAQATVTDFLDYTEFFPSDLFRSLSLIGKLDETFEEDANKIHHLTKTYGTLPSLPEEDRPNPQTLRKNITTTLGHALRCRESSHAEAVRLCDVADSLYIRLEGIRKKLHNMPLPPSRDPTPAPKTRSPLRSRKPEERTPRLTLLMESARAGAGGSRQKNRSHRIIVPGDILPPFDPNSPGVSDVSESEAEEPSPVEPPPKLKLKQRTQKQLPSPEPPSPPKKLVVRPPGVMGTNAHSTVAGISVSNAMANLTPPPPDAQPGSEHAPWLELTEWELNMIRRRMKKNANWDPSDIMKARELEDLGRGLEAYKKAKAEAEANGTTFLNEAPHESSKPPEAYENGEETANLTDTKSEAVINRANRAMKLNDLKKMKREQRELELQREMEENMNLIKGENSKSEGLFSNVNGLGLMTPKQQTKKYTRKRKADEAAEDTPLTVSLPNPKAAASNSKRIKLSSSALQAEENDSKTTTSQVPLAPESSSAETSPPATAKNNKTSTRASDRSLKISLASTPSQPAKTNTSKPAPATEPPPRTRKLSLYIDSNDAAQQDANNTSTPWSGRRTSARTAATADTSSNNKPSANTPSISHYTTNTKTLGSTTSLQQTAAGSRERRQPTKATSTSNTTTNATSSHPSRRKSTSNLPASTSQPSTKLQRHTTTSKTPKKPLRPRAPSPSPSLSSEDADPNEPRYCICNGVSSGEMIMCDAEPHCKSGEWFHYECLGWTELPKRARARKWFCPVCRRRRGVDEWGDAVVVAGKRGSRGGGR